MKLPQFLEGFLHRIIPCAYKKQIIPDYISDTELIVRGIFTPLFYSKSKNELKEGAFLPSPRNNSREVSVLRRDFTTDDFCKKHCKAINISGNIFCGFATFLAKHISELTIRHGIEETVFLRVSPLCKDLKSECTLRPIRKGQPGLPMHADLYYSIDFEPGRPQTRYRRFAKELATTVSNYYQDDNPDLPQWTNAKLSWSQK